MNRRPDEAARLKGQAVEYAAKLPTYAPRFDFEVGWASDYGALFEQQYTGTTGPRDLVARAISSGRVMLHAEGGSGKTSILHTLYRFCLEGAALPVMINLRSWSADVSE